MKTWIKFAAAAAMVCAVAAGADDIGKKFVDPTNAKAVTVAKETPFVRVNGQNVYFADAASRTLFLKTPEAFLKTTQECPVKNIKGRANKSNRVVVNDEIIYFCCAMCPGDFAKEPQSYLFKTRDVVSGKEFSLASDSPKSEYKGGTYFFENAENKAAFDKEQAKFAKVVLQ
jgi:YHS domain-containing protein